MKDQIKELTPQYMRCTAAVCPAIYEEVTPKDMRCTALACPSIYEEVTPKDMQCMAWACPAIYEEVTPEKMRCAAAVCPQIHKGEDNYLIVGEQINPSDFGLEKKVGKGEALIRVPKALIDKNSGISLRNNLSKMASYSEFNSMRFSISFGCK